MIAALVESGKINNIPPPYRLGEQSTFATGGPEEGVEGSGRPRIDTILGNRAAVVITTGCRFRWGLIAFDHVPIEVTTSRSIYDCEAKVIEMPKAFPAEQLCHDERPFVEIWQDEWLKLEANFNGYEANEQLRTCMWHGARQL